jgi:hypothetical protein
MQTFPALKRWANLCRAYGARKLISYATSGARFETSPQHKVDSDRLAET